MTNKTNKYFKDDEEDKTNLSLKGKAAVEPDPLLLSTAVRQANESFKFLGEDLASFSKQAKLLGESFTLNFQPLIEELQCPAKNLLDFQQQTLKMYDALSLQMPDLTPFSNCFEQLESTLRIVKGEMIDLPIANAFNILDVSTSLNLQLNRFDTIELAKDKEEYEVSGLISEVHAHSSIEFKRSIHVEMRLERVEGELQLNNRKLDQLMEQNEHQANVIEHLVEYIKKTRSTTAKVKSIQYNQKTTTLRIDDGEEIVVKKNQEALCKALFKDAKTISKKWFMDELVAEMDEDYYDDNNWESIIYQTARRVNNKIKDQTGIPDFILATTKTVVVNPKYIE